MVGKVGDTIPDAGTEYTEDTSDAEYPKSIPEDIDKCTADAASVRKIISKPCDSRDHLEVSRIA